MQIIRFGKTCKINKQSSQSMPQQPRNGFAVLEERNNVRGGLFLMQPL